MSSREMTEEIKEREMKYHSKATMEPILPQSSHYTHCLLVEFCNTLKSLETAFYQHIG